MSAHNAKNVLVLGGAGYIGSIVSAELVAQGHTVVVYDDLSKGHREAVPAGASFVKADVLDGDTLLRVLRTAHIDAVVHLAACSLVGESCSNPAKYYWNNVVGGLTLLDAMRDAGVLNLVFSSSAAVYGEPRGEVLTELDATLPTNPYGTTKLAFEQALAWYREAYGLRSISLRYFNAAGATDERGEDHDPETHLIPLVLQCAEGRRANITIFGDDYDTKDGTCVRDYIHVVDLAHAHVLAVDALKNNKPHSPVYNLGCGGDGYTVKDVIDTAARVTGRQITVCVGARRPGDPTRLVADASLIAAELGWRPHHQNLDDIVSSAWRFMRLMKKRRDAGIAAEVHAQAHSHP